MRASFESRKISWLRDSDGKGTLGCLFALLLLGMAVFVVVRTGPDYYAYKSFEADVKTEASRAGGNFFDDDAVIRDVMDLARKNEIRIEREDIKIERFAGQVFIKVHCTIPMDLIFYERSFDFDINASSYIGRL